MNEENNKSLQEKILDAIQSGQIKPRSKWYFYGQSAILTCALILTGLFLLFLGSLIIFNLRQNGAWFAPAFGFYGIRIFITSLPWLLILAVVILLVLAETLLKRYKFSYQQPMLYTFVGAGLVFAVGVMFVSQAHIHEELFEQARTYNLILGGPVYRHYGLPPGSEVTRGIIFEKNDAGCKIKTLSEEDLQVLISSQTRLPDDYNFLLGDVIIVLGPREGRIIRAFGIKKIGSGMMQNFTSPIPQPLLQPQFMQ